MDNQETGDVWSHKTSLSQPLVFRILIWHCFQMFVIGVWNCFDSVVFNWFFHLIAQNVAHFAFELRLYNTWLEIVLGNLFHRLTQFYFLVNGHCSYTCKWQARTFHALSHGTTNKFSSKDSSSYTVTSPYQVQTMECIARSGPFLVIR